MAKSFKVKSGRTFLVHNQDKIDDQIARSIVAREAEIASYDLNIELFESQLQGDITPEFRAQLEARIVSENRELAKSEATYQALLASLPAGVKRDAALARVSSQE